MSLDVLTLLEGPPFQELDRQRVEVSYFLKKDILKGDLWYIVDSKWFKQWKIYVGYEVEETSNYGEDRSHPGPIDNGNILIQNNKNEMKDGLIEDVDYTLIPSEAWNVLQSAYGLADGQNPIERKVIELGIFIKNNKVEIYLLKINICKYRAIDKVYSRYFSKLDSINDLEMDARKVLNIPDSEEVRLWNKFGDNAIERLENKESTLHAEGYVQGQTIIVEQKDADGTWPLKSKKMAQVLENPIPANTISNNPRRSYHNDPGICGLSNLGNTCFMNSALQCMGNVSLLTQYFLDDKYWDEINTSNPLGMKGEMAKYYAELIKSMWSGKYAYYAPRNFKTIVGKFAPQFSGYQQQDSQELMAFLLDGLHEDLNRVKNKPFVEIVDASGRPDKEVAEETWSNYLKRNNSIIVDIFHGLLKSTIVCPECTKVSETFDPFCYLSLPLPTKKERILEVTYCPIDPERTPLRIKLALPKMGCIQDVCNSAGRLLNIAPERLLVVDVYNSKFHKMFRTDEILLDILDKDDICLYEIPPEYKEAPIFILPVYLRERVKNYNRTANAYFPKLFGRPFLVVIPQKGITYQQLYENILKNTRRYVVSPNPNDKWWIESSNSASESEMTSYDESDSDTETLPDKKLFAISSINTFGNVIIESFEDNDKPLNIMYRTYLSIEWEIRAKELFYDEFEASKIEMHESMNQVKLQKTKSINLDDCLEMFTSTEILGADDPWFCPSCQKHQRATKKFDLWSLPKTLIIHLKRFSYSRFLRDKVDLLIEFPFQGLDMSEYVLNSNHEKVTYDLVAVANHYGGMIGGHYTAFAKNRILDKWFYFDDGNVSASNETQVLSKAAYVLFYQRSVSSSDTIAVTPTSNTTTTVETDE